MTKTAFYYKLGYQMTKVAKKNEGYKYDYGEEFKHQLPFWLGGALGLEYLRSLDERAKGKTLLKGYDMLTKLHPPKGGVEKAVSKTMRSVYKSMLKSRPTVGGVAKAIGLGTLLTAISAVPTLGITTTPGVMPFIGESALNTLGASILDRLVRGGPSTPQRMLGAAAAGTGITAISRALRKKEKRWF